MSSRRDTSLSGGLQPPSLVASRAVRGADTDRKELAPESRGLEAMAEGFRLHYQDDQEQLRAELPVYDALYAYCRRLAVSASP